MIDAATLEQARRLTLRTRRLVTGQFAGQFPSVYKGSGIEFAEVREYVDGDDVRSIDWNVSARSGRVFVKRHIEERNLTVMMAVDVSGSTLFGTGDASKRERACEIALALAVAAIAHGDRAGLALFSEQLELSRAPARGRNTALGIAATLLGYEPRWRGTAFGPCLAQLARACRTRSIIFLISDFLASGGSQALVGALGALAKHHDVVPIWLYDRVEDSLPDVGLVALRDSETDRDVLFDTSSSRSRARFEAARQDDVAGVRAAFRRLGLDHVRIALDDDWTQAVGALLAARRRARRRG